MVDDQNPSSAEVNRVLRRLEKQVIDISVGRRGRVNVPAASGAPDLLAFPNSDTGNALRLIAMSGDDLRYCHATKSWMVWYKGRWKADDSGQARELAERTINEFIRQASNAAEAITMEAIAANGTDDSSNSASADTIKSLKFAEKCVNRGPLSNMLYEAERKRHVTPADLDVSPWLLNFTNGTVDLESEDCELYPHNRSDLITKMVHYPCDPHAKCPVFLRFLNQIMGGDSNPDRAARMVDFLQRALGYSLVGVTTEKAMFIAVGGKDSGKTTLLNFVRELIDEYSTIIDADSLMARGKSGKASSSVQADIADLRGVRFAMSSEPDRDQKMSAATIKRLTKGKGKTKAIKKYEDWITFRESHTVWMDGNFPLLLSDLTDEAALERLYAIEFFVVPKDQIDIGLDAKLLAEAPGVLGWLVEGARKWRECRLNPPPEIAAARERFWRNARDPITRFLSERCITDARSKTGSTELYLEYLKWFNAAGIEREPETICAFGIAMAKKFERKHDVARNEYLGVGLKP